MTTTQTSTDAPMSIGDHGAGSRFGLWVVTAVLGLFLFAAGAPTPLYGIYGSRWGFSPTMLTVIFAVYAVALLATLLVAGSVSDAVGRRPVILAALAMQSLSMLAFLVADGHHSANHLLGGATAFALCTAGAAASLLVRRWTPYRTTLLGCVLLIGGLAVTVVSIADADGRLLLVGSVVSGAGFGSTFLGAFRTLAAAASPARRGELIAALYVAAYLAFSLPAVVAGVLTTHVGLRDTSIGYATVVAALAIGSLTATRTHAALA